jgi:hypothetical protein
MFCAGEIGPVAGRTFVHGFTASGAMAQNSTTPVDFWAIVNWVWSQT